MDLDIIRQEIDQIDDQIVKLLEERMHLVEGVVAYKKASGKPILDTKREAIIFEKVRSRVEDKRYQETIVRNVFRTYSNVRVIIRIKTSNEKRTILSARDFSSFHVGWTGSLPGFHLVTSQSRFSLGNSLCQLSGNFLLGLSVKGYLVYKGTSKGLVLALGTGFCGGLTTLFESNA